MCMPALGIFIKMRCSKANTLDMLRHIWYYHNIKGGSGMDVYGRNILIGAACEQMATLLIDICGFSSGDMAFNGITMPISPASIPL